MLNTSPLLSLPKGELNLQTSLAFYISYYYKEFLHFGYFVFDEMNAYFIRDRAPIYHWSIKSMHFDMTGCEILTKTGDIIYLKKDIHIRKKNGEEIVISCKPIEICEIFA